MAGPPRIPRKSAAGFGLIAYALIALAVLGAVSAVVAGIYMKGKGEGKAEVQALWDAANKLQRDREAAAIKSATERLEARNEKTRTVYRTINREVEKVVDRVEYRDLPCFDPVLLRLANCAIRGQDAASCEPDKPMPRTGTAN